MLVRTCVLDTERLRAREWHAMAAETQPPQDLDRIVAHILTESVTRALPASWHGRYSVERARGWIKARDAEGTVLLVVEESSRRAIGLLLLTEIGTADGLDIRVGYVVAEPFWHRGFASEVVAGLVAWSRAQPLVASLAAGVAKNNPASARVLEKNGFRVSNEENQIDRSDLVLRLSLR